MGPGGGGVPKIFWLLLESYYFCELRAHVKFLNPTTTLSGILGAVVEKKKIKIPKIMSFLSCSTGRMHFARTNNKIDMSHLNFHRRGCLMVLKLCVYTILGFISLGSNTCPAKNELLVGSAL